MCIIHDISYNLHCKQDLQYQDRYANLETVLISIPTMYSVVISEAAIQNSVSCFLVLAQWQMGYHFAINHLLYPFPYLRNY